jgi:serine/threonine protein kinase/Tol biopolymer transport system component
MPQIAVGSKLETYEIVQHLGSGGMGDVYRARDARLGRDVAIKVLPEDVAGNAERLARFRQEARTAGTLNHPNLVTIFDIGTTAEGVTFLVMELLEGETLRDVLSRLAGEGRRMPMRMFLDYATQIARGLSAAHERRIVHRDLKPENIFVTTDGRVKILDFGLAKQQGDDASQPDAATARLETAPGTVMGTASYMSPEQARGATVDHRSDLFSFGAILFELLAFKRPFDRETVHETLTAIIREDPPDLAVEAPDTPPSLRLTVQHCLEKRPDDRYQSARDLGFQLASLSTISQPAITGEAPPPARANLRWPLFAAVVVGSLLAGGFAGRWLQRSEPQDEPQLRYLTFSGTDSDPAAAPDGKTVAFVSSRDGQRRIWLKQLATGSEAPLTSGPAFSPRFVPDGTAVLYARGAMSSDGSDAHASLYRIGLVGGDERKVIDQAVEGEYSPDGKRIAYVRHGPRDAGGVPWWTLYIADADGGNERKLDEATGSNFFAPRFSPDGRRLAVTFGAAEGTADGGIRIFELDGGKPRQLQYKESLSAVSWIDDEELVFGRFGTLALARVLPVTIVRQRIDGSAPHALLALPSGQYGVDLLAGGRLLITTPMARMNLQVVDKTTGASRWIVHGFAANRQPVFSPDGGSVLFTSDRNGNLDLWMMDLASGATRQITDHPGEDWDPAFSPDGRNILWSSNRSGHFEAWACNVDGTNARQLSHDGFDGENPTQTLDGRTVYASGNPKRAGIWLIERDGRERRITADGVLHPEVSPDGRYVVAHGLLHRPDGKLESHLRGYELATGRSWVIARGLGDFNLAEINVGRPRISMDSKRVYYLAADATNERFGVYSLPLDPAQSDPSLRVAEAGFDPDHLTETFGVSPDGKSIVTAEIFRQSTIVLVEGLESLKRK